MRSLLAVEHVHGLRMLLIDRFVHVAAVCIGLRSLDLRRLAAQACSHTMPKAQLLHNQYPEQVRWERVERTKKVKAVVATTYL